MIYLILAILSSAMISVLMRVSEKYSQNNVGMLAANYLMCTAMAWVYTGSPALFPEMDGLMVSLGMGLVSGALYLGSFMLLQWNIRKNGVVLPATFMKLGVLVPTVVSILIFGESPRLTQLIGIAMAVGAIFMIQGGSKEAAASTIGLVILLLAGGITDTMSKVYEEIGPAALKDHYLLYTFGVALILCAALCAIRRKPLRAADILFGLAIGVPNYFSARFLLLSLADVPAVVAYPSYSVGTIIVVTLAGLLLFRTRLDRRRLISLGVILAALALLNL